MSQYSQGQIDDMLGLDTPDAQWYRLMQGRGRTPAEQAGAVRGPSLALQDDDASIQDPPPAAPPPAATPPPRSSIVWGQPNPAPNVPGGWQDEHTGGFVPENGGNRPGYMDLSYWASRGIPPDQIYDFATGQLRQGWRRTGNGYERVTAGGPPPTTDGPNVTNTTTISNPYDFGGGGMTNPNEGFQWPTYNAPRLSFPDFSGFKPFTPPSMDEILADPVLQAQLTEGRRGIKQDRAFRGILNTGDTLKDIFDWSSDRVKLGANDAFDRAFKVYDINERQNPFNTWSANRDLAYGLFDRNAPQARDEFLFNQYEPAKARFDDNYRRWRDQGNWLTQVGTNAP